MCSDESTLLQIFISVSCALQVGAPWTEASVVGARDGGPAPGARLPRQLRPRVPRAVPRAHPVRRVRGVRAQVTPPTPPRLSPSRSNVSYASDLSLALRPQNRHFTCVT